MKSQDEVKKMLDDLKSDERLSYSVADIQTNASLALIQLSLEERVRILCWVLEEPLPIMHQQRKSGLRK